MFRWSSPFPMGYSFIFMKRFGGKWVLGLGFLRTLAFGYRSGGFRGSRLRAFPSGKKYKFSQAWGRSDGVFLKKNQVGGVQVVSAVWISDGDI